MMIKFLPGHSIKADRGVFKATRIGKDTALAQIIGMVKRAQEFQTTHRATRGCHFSLFCSDRHDHFAVLSALVWF